MSFKLLLAATACFAAAVVAVPSRSGEWSASELGTLRGMSLEALGPPPPDTSNRVADDPRAADLGALLFADRRMSGNGRVSCATCHDPAHGFTDRTPTGRGVGTGSRRTMPIEPAVYSAWQFWDGRADSLWAQALGPIENPLEHGFTRGEVVDLVGTAYRDRYERLFGPLPRVGVGAASPVGDTRARARWSQLDDAQRSAINTAFANAGKAIAAFERRQRMQPTRFDLFVSWLAGSRRGPSPMTQTEVAGLRVFLGKGQCSTCHSGPLFTNNEFANTGVPDPSRPAGRAAAISIARADPFNCRGRFNDAPLQGCGELDFAPSGVPEQEGAFKVPSLRGVAQRPPYMHAGQFRSLDQVIRHYERAPAAASGRSQLKPIPFTAEERSALKAFLLTLDPEG